MSIEIRYTSEPERDYCRLLPLQKSLKALRSFTKRYELIAGDAHEIAKQMTEEDFAVFRVGLAKEKAGEFAGEDFMIRFGAILLPSVILQVGLIANHFKAPFGLVYIRMKDAGRLVEKNGVASIVPST